MKKTMSKKLISILIVLLLSISVVPGLISCDNDPAISKLEIVLNPSVVDYIVGDTFSAEGGELKVTYDDGSDKVVSLTSEEVTLSSVDMTTPGEKTISVSYLGKTTSFKINVSGSEAGKIVQSIEIKTKPTKISYAIEDVFDPSGGVLTVKYNDDSVEEIAFDDENVKVSSPNMYVTGQKIVTVLYGNKTANFKISISGEVDPVPTVEVLRITIKKEPNKKEYFIGETFDPTGGVITVTYSDDSTVDLPFDDEEVSLSVPDLSTKDSKSVVVTYNKKRATFYIFVAAVGGVVTFDHNYTDSPNDTLQVAENRAVAKPANPIRSGYTFYKWYTDAACTREYDFSTSNIVRGDIRIYAYWKQDGKTYYDVKYDLNYYGVKLSVIPQAVQAGESARSISDPVRNEYNFEGWYTDSQLNSKYNAAAINQNTTLYAKWSKTKTGSSTYIFEAEYTDLTGKSGPGYSGASSGESMIVYEEKLNPSNGAFVSYLYRNGNSLDFHFASGEVDTNATVTIRMTAELDNVKLTKDNYLIKINGVVQSYADLALVAESNFSDILTFSGVTLNKGYNFIQLITNNNVNPLGQGVGTYEATAPIVDCIKITSTAVLIWDGNYSLPANI